MISGCFVLLNNRKGGVGMSKSYMITNRRKRKKTYGSEPEKRGELYFLTAANSYDNNWEKYNEVEKANFKDSLFEDLKNIQKRDEPAKMAIFIHGYNTSFDEAVAGYSSFGKSLKNHNWDGLLVGYSWPSEGTSLGYIEDRDDARESVTGFVHLMNLIKLVRMPAEKCYIDVSMISHSMGNYVLREGLSYFSKQVGYPRNDIYFTQTLLLGADISYNSLELDGSGRSICDFSHRVTAYFNKNDNVLGLSRGVKHFGNRRLGRSGPSDYSKLPQNVVAVDCCKVANKEICKKSSIHSSYFVISEELNDFVSTMNGIDRGAIPGRLEIAGTNRCGFQLIKKN